MKRLHLKKDAPKGDKHKSRKKKLAAAGVAAVVLATGMAVNEGFDPQDLLQSSDGSDRSAVREQTRYTGQRTVAELESYERISLADAARSWFIRLPVAVKGTILLPLWAIGAIPVALASAFSPLGWALLALALQVIVLIVLFCGVYKLVFPQRKVRELFRKKNLKRLFLGALTVTLANILLTQLWTDWPVWRSLLLSVVGLAVLCVLYKRICGAFRAPEPDVVRTRLVAEG